MKKSYLFLAIATVAISAIVVTLTLGNNDSDILADLGLENLTTEELVLAVDAKTLESSVYSSSVTGEYLTISTSKEILRVEIPEDKFYLSPYLFGSSMMPPLGHWLRCRWHRF